MLAFVAIAGLLLLNQWVFRCLFDLSYVEWFASKAAVIGLVTSVVTQVWNRLEKNTGLVSADPGAYAAAALFTAGIPLFAFGTQIRLRPSHGGASPQASPLRALMALGDTLLMAGWVLVLTLALLAWLVIVAPAQYVVFLVCAAPSRRFLRARTRPVVSDLGGRVTMFEWPADTPVPEGGWDAGLQDKPIALANLCASLLFFGLSLLR